MEPHEDAPRVDRDDQPDDVYQPPAAEDIDVSAGPAVTVAGAAQTVMISDSAAKDQIAPIDVSDVLDRVAGMEITRWSYRDEPSVRHIGPMAQDFAAAFAVGRDDRHIHTVDANGVALASIQALRQLVDRQAEEIQALRAEVAALRRT